MEFLNDYLNNLLNNELNESEGNVEEKISQLAKDKKIQKALGTTDTQKIKDGLLMVFKRGVGAAKTNWASVRPQIKKIGKPGAYYAWAHARINVFVKKGTTYQTADSDIADWLKGKGDKPK